MMYYFYAPSGTGKSAIKTAMLEPFLKNKFKANRDSKGLLEFLKMSPKRRYRLCLDRIDYLNKRYETSFEKPIHTIQSNEEIYTTIHGNKVVSYDLPGDRIGLYDEFFETYCPPPHSIIAWDEAQKEVGGRDSSSMDPRVSSFCQLHRKWGIDMLCFSQRGGFLDLTIRDNCKIIEVESMEHKFNNYGLIKSTTWKLKFFNSLKQWERYISTDKKTYKTTEFTYNGNVFDHFDSDEGEEYFIYLAQKRGLNLRTKVKTDKVDDYIKFNPYTPPDQYKKMSKAEKEKIKKEREKQHEKSA